MLARSIVSWLTKQSSVTTLLGDRYSIRTDIEPQGEEEEYINVKTIRNTEDTCTGSSPGLVGIQEEQVEFMCVSDTVEKARSIALAVKAAINSLGRGEMATGVFINSFSNLDYQQRQGASIGGEPSEFPAFLLNVTYHFTET